MIAFLPFPSPPCWPGRLIVLALLSALLASCAPWSTSPPRARVRLISDGDTIVVDLAGERRRLRLACVDAPELSQRPDGLTSRAQLLRLLPIGSSVTLAIKDHDRYGRLVAEVFAPRSINLAMVAAGQAFVYPAFVDRCDALALQAAQARAARLGLGIWRHPGGINRPWNHRRRARPRFSASAAESSARSHPAHSVHSGPD